MRAWAALAVLVAGLSACGDSGDAPAGLTVARLVGDVCGVPVLAGAVVIDDGLVVTAAHVLAGAKPDALSVRTTTGVEAQARVVGFDPERDLALLAVDGLDAPVARLGFDAAFKPASVITLTRNGELIEFPLLVKREITATGDDIYGEGSVSRRALELSVNVERGMSGSGVFDGGGRLVGILFAESRNNDVAYAVAASEIEDFIDESDAAVEVDAGHC